MRDQMSDSRKRGETVHCSKRTAEESRDLARWDGNLLNTLDGVGGQRLVTLPSSGVITGKAGLPLVGSFESGLGAERGISTTVDAVAREAGQRMKEADAIQGQ